MANGARVKAQALVGMALLLAVFAGCGGGEPDAMEAAGLSVGRWGHTATLLEDGRVLIVGGQESPSRRLDSAEIYDPAADTWTSAGSMSVARGLGHRATRLSDGRVLVTGDSDEAIAEIYDPSSGQWSQAGVMTEARNFATSTLMGDGRVLVTGGVDATKAGQEPLSTVEVFDPETGEWTETASLKNEEFSHGAVPLQDGNVLVAGRELTQVYDFATNTWEDAGVPKRERSSGYPVTLLQDGRVLVTGGSFQPRRGIAAEAPIRNVEIYDPSASEWTRVADMNDARANHTAVLLQTADVLLVAGGELQIYDPGADMWESAGNLTYPRDAYYTATVLPDGRVLIVGGRETTDAGRTAGISQVEIFDPATFEGGN